MAQRKSSQDLSNTLRTETTQVSKDDLDREILEHIANFGGYLSDLNAVFGAPSDSSTDHAWGATREAACLSEEEIASKVRSWKKQGLIVTDKNRRAEAAFYLCTHQGMRQAGFESWFAGLSRPRDTARLERGSDRNRLVAAVAAALRIILEREGVYQDIALLSVWGIRRQGRVPHRYQFENAIGVRHLPAIVIKPRKSSEQKPTVIEVFDGSLNENQIKTLCGIAARDEDIGSLRYYVTEADLSTVRQVVRDLDPSRRIKVYAMPESAGALTIVGLAAESIPRASELTSDERKLQLAVLRCVGEFGSASESGLMEFFGSEDKRAVKRCIDVGAKAKLLRYSRYPCDGVKLIWLTEAGASESGTKAFSSLQTLSQARAEKDALRVAALLARRFPSRLVANSRSMERAGRRMPTIGPSALAVRPVFLVKKDKTDKSPVAVFVINEIRTEAELAELVSACIVDRSMSQILIYAASTMITVLKAIVSAQDEHSRISVRPLPVSEGVETTRKAEDVRIAAEEERQAARCRVLARKAARAATPRTRSERHVAGLPGETPVSEEMWNAFSRALYERVERPAGHGVSWRLVVNVLIWLVETHQGPAALRHLGYAMGAETFKRRLDVVHKVGLWEALQTLVTEHVASNVKDGAVSEPLSWRLITPVIKRRGCGAGAASRYRKIDSDQTADKRGLSKETDIEALIAELNRLTLPEASGTEDE